MGTASDSGRPVTGRAKWVRRERRAFVGDGDDTEGRGRQYRAQNEVVTGMKKTEELSCVEEISDSSPSPSIRGCSSVLPA